MGWLTAGVGGGGVSVSEPAPGNPGTASGALPTPVFGQRPAGMGPAEPWPGTEVTSFFLMLSEQGAHKKQCLSWSSACSGRGGNSISYNELVQAQAPEPGVGMRGVCRRHSPL